jgi:hypothetical protein
MHNVLLNPRTGEQTRLFDVTTRKIDNQRAKTVVSIT